MSDRTAAMPGVMHVMAGLVLDAEGRVLLGQRQPGKHLAGYWEFPGGKLEVGESPKQGLARELLEELGLVLREAEPLIRVPWRYSEQDRELLLDAWRVTGWQGSPQSLEGQALQWQFPAAIDPAWVTPADRPILHALRLPPRYAITPADVAPSQRAHWFERIVQWIDRGGRLVQLRLPRWSRAELRGFAAELLPMARRHGAQLLLNGDADGAAELGIGVHLTSRQLQTTSLRPLPLTQLVAASCHDAAALARALQCGVDFAVLSPVAVSASHPLVAALGWGAFHAMVEAASLPVYALGGMRMPDLPQALAAGGQGIAGISGFWNEGMPLS